MISTFKAGAMTRAVRRAVLLLLFCCCIAQSTAIAANSVPAAAPGASASGYAVYDCLTGRFIAEGNGDAVLRMASTTKIVTALVALENFSLDQEVTFTKEMTAIGSSMYLKYGETVTVRDLLYGLMLMSGNDAARALASLADGGETGFVKLMNQKAKSLGLTNTQFQNPNGLDDDGHHTTAKELAIITAEALNNPVFREIASTRSGIFAGRHMTNHNKLLSRIDGCIGVKTGYTTGAGRCLVSAVERLGRDVIVVTLGASNDWRDHTTLHAWAADSYPVTTILSDGQVLYNLAIAGGTNNTVPLIADSPVTLGLSPDETARVQVELYVPKFAYAPIKKGANAGYAAVMLDGIMLARIDMSYAGHIVAEQPREATLGMKLTDLLETLAWSVGICYNAG